MRSRGRNSTEFPLPPTGGASPISPRPPALVTTSRSIDPRNPPLTSQFVHSRAPCPNSVSGSILGRFGTATQETHVPVLVRSTFSGRSTLTLAVFTELVDIIEGLADLGGCHREFSVAVA